MPQSAQNNLPENTAELKISNQNNNLLTTLIIEDPEKSFIQKTQDVYLPIINKFDQLYFSYRDLDGNIINLNADISYQITVEDFVKNDIKNDEDISFCYSRKKESKKKHFYWNHLLKQSNDKKYNNESLFFPSLGGEKY